ncbi:hypothetical protein D6C79_03007 [Aureobasidium pullulans]|nr:hypothetical protein D6C79_03007 [Aureobasidium pullulans]
MASTTSDIVPAEPADPGFYPPSQTALLLLDFHEMFLQHAGPSAVTAVATAAKMRRWATKRGILVIHALIDTSKSPFGTCRDANRYKTIVAAMVSSGTSDEPSQVKTAMSMLIRPLLIHTFISTIPTLKAMIAFVSKQTITSYP